MSDPRSIKYYGRVMPANEPRWRTVLLDFLEDKDIAYETLAVKIEMPRGRLRESLIGIRPIPWIKIDPLAESIEISRDHLVHLLSVPPYLHPDDAKEYAGRDPVIYSLIGKKSGMKKGYVSRRGEYNQKLLDLFDDVCRFATEHRDSLFLKTQKTVELARLRGNNFGDTCGNQLILNMSKDLCRHFPHKHYSPKALALFILVLCEHQARLGLEKPDVSRRPFFGDPSGKCQPKHKSFNRGVSVIYEALYGRVSEYDYFDLYYKQQREFELYERKLKRRDTKIFQLKKRSVTGKQEAVVVREPVVLDSELAKENKRLKKELEAYKAYWRRHQGQQAPQAPREHQGQQAPREYRSASMPQDTPRTRESPPQSLMDLSGTLDDYWSR